MHPISSMPVSYTHLDVYKRQAGADVNTSDDRGRTALMRAAFLGHDRCVEVLLDAGAEINAQDEVGRSALMEACVAFKKDVIRMLIERNADVNLCDNNGCTALMLSLIHI